MLLDNKDAPFVAYFDKDAKLQSKQRLHLPEHVSPQSFAVFDDKALIVRGVYGDRALKELQGRRFAALLDDSGAVIKEFQHLGSSSDEPQTIFDASTVLGDDAYVYLLNRDRVLVLSRTGETVRTLRFSNPDPGSIPVAVQVSSGVISISMQKVNTQKRVEFTYLLLNAGDGNRIGYYGPDSSEGSSLPLCFNRDQGFTFYRPAAGQVKLTVAGVR